MAGPGALILTLLLALACAPEKPADSGSIETGSDDTGRPDTDADDTGPDDTDLDDTGPDDTDDDLCTFYADADGDGWGSRADTSEADCGVAPTGYTTESGDCDDTDAEIHPGVEDLDCDNVDDDCDGAVDGGWRVPEDQLDIQVTINSAPEGSTICVGPGTYVTGLDFRGKAQRVIGREGPGVTIIDAAAAFSAVKFTSGEGADALLQGFTLQNGRSAQGAGLYIRDASPTLRDLVIAGNVCQDLSSAGRCEGAGVWISGGTPAFEDVVVRANTHHAAVSQGAGVFVSAGGPTFTRVEVTGNTQVGVEGSSFLQGAGVFLTASTPVLDSVTVSGNTQTYTGTSACSLDGAGLYVSALNAAWSGLVVSDNAQVCGGSGCNGSGAGLYASASTVLVLDGANITGNTADSPSMSPNVYGAGISAYAGVDLTLRNSVVSGNRLTTRSGLAHGGGLYGRSDVSFTFENTVLAGNVADGAESAGGAICLQEYADATLTNSIVAGNVVDGSGTGRGAGIFARNDTVTLTQVDVVGNDCASSVCNGVAFNLYTDVRLSFDGVNVVGNTGTSGRTSGGALHAEYDGSTLTSVWSNMYGNESSELFGVTTPAVGDGNVFVDPGYTDTSAADPTSWDLTLASESAVRDAGDPGASDPDGSRADIGAWGGPGAAGW
ncbi:MAG: MopE-related protein [Pseudomonadota bacterium]|nr:MopE-related protein [Pseudomonadota bacterium]